MKAASDATLAALGLWGTGMGTRPTNTKCAEVRVVPACDVEGRPIQFRWGQSIPSQRDTIGAAMFVAFRASCIDWRGEP
jgi:hypothetical protein